MTSGMGWIKKNLTRIDEVMTFNLAHVGKKIRPLRAKRAESIFLMAARARLGSEPGIF
jgi:hypothetical protein